MKSDYQSENKINPEDKLRGEHRLEMIENQDKFKLELIAAVSHEIRTPLAITKQLITLLFEETAGPINNKQREVLVKAQVNLERLKNIMDEMLDMSKIEKDKFNLKYSSVNLNELLNDVFQNHQSLVKEKKLKFDLILPKIQIEVFIDPERTRQAITNLLNNAVKFSKPGGHIRLEAKLRQYFVHIGVYDTGIGISKENCKKIFERFVKLPQQDVYMNQGMGLGLSIVHEIVRKQGGESWVHSQIGKGSKFYISIPRFHTLQALSYKAKNMIIEKLDEFSNIGVINLSIINFEDIQHKINLSPKKLFEEINQTAQAVFQEIVDPAFLKRYAAVANSNEGTINFIFYETPQKNLHFLSKILSEKIKSYCLKNNLSSVFIAVGLSLITSKNKNNFSSAESMVSPLKEFYVSSDMRRSKRIKYQSRLEIVWPHSAVQQGETVDIYYYGVCFTGPKILKTDQQVRTRIFLYKIRKSIEISARIAWVSKVESSSTSATPLYKIGMEFVKFKKGDYEKLVKELKLHL